MTPVEARRRFSEARPHIVPFVFAVEADTVYSSVDHKPKRTRVLRRLNNIAENPAVSVLVDHYEDVEWANLWWVRGDGTARIVEPGSGEAQRAITLLQERYDAYVDQPPAGPVVAIDVHRWSGWTG